MNLGLKIMSEPTFHPGSMSSVVLVRGLTSLLVHHQTLFDTDPDLTAAAVKQRLLARLQQLQVPSGAMAMRDQLVLEPPTPERGS